MPPASAERNPSESIIKSSKTMIKKSEPLSDFIAQYLEVGLDVGVFPTQSGDRYALRLVDPDEPQIGTAFLASFSKKVKEADRPADAAAQVEASKALDALIHSDKASTKLVVCHCVVDDESVEKFGFDEEDLGNTFLSISYPGTAESDSYREAKAEAKNKRVRK